MKICALHHIPWQIFVCHILLYLTTHFVNEADAKLGHAGWAKSDSRTKQLLQNIRTQIAQQTEQQQAKECDPKISQCNVPQSKEPEEEEGSAEEASPEVATPFRFRGRHKTAADVKKDTSRAFALKGRKPAEKKKSKNEETEPKTFTKKVKEIDKPQEKKLKDEIKDVKSREKIPKDTEDEVKKKLKKLEIKEPKKFEEKEPRKFEVKEPKESEEKEAKKSEVKEPKKSEVKEPKKVQHEPPKPKSEKKKQERERKETEESKQPKKISKRETDERETKKDDKQKKLTKTEGFTRKPEVRPKWKQEERQDENVRFPEDVPVFSLASDSVKSEQCKKHSRIYLRQLKRFKLWALMMYDATAKIPSGILQGNTNQYGDFDQCISINATFKKQVHDGVSGIQGKYCLATIDVSSDSPDAGLQHAIHRSQSFGFIKSKISDPGHFIPRFSTINWGLCIPSACKAEDLENSIKQNLQSYRKRSGLKFDVKVEDKNCVTKMDLLSDYDMKTFVTLLFYAAVIGVAIYATLRDMSRKSKLKAGTASKFGAKHEAITDEGTEANDIEDEEKPEETTSHGKLKALIMAFSLKRNMKKLFIEGESEDSIDCIHGIKSIFTMMLYFAHKTIPLALTPFSNRVVLTEISNEATSILLRGSIIYTDSFLLISGVLTAFNLGKEIRRKGRILWIRRIVARYIRLTPALLSTLLFYAYISDNLGSGPLWNVVVSENSRLCQENMWKNLLYIQNFFPFEEMCAPQTHQLALDMQLYLVSPVLVYLLHEYDKIGVGILQAFLMISSILRFITTSNNELSLFIFHGMPVTQLYETANLLYSQPVHRATPYLVGVLVGYYLQKVGKDYKLPNLVSVFGWVVTICLAAGSLIAPAHLAKQNYKYGIEEASHYAALIPIAWSAALGWFITACYLGCGGKINQYLNCRGFIVFSRISYSIYLTQFLVFSHIIGSKKIPEMFSVLGSIDLVEFAEIAFVSIAMTLLLDIPTVEIKKIILDCFPSSKPTIAEPDTEPVKGGVEIESDVQEVIPKLKNEPDYDSSGLSESKVVTEKVLTHGSETKFDDVEEVDVDYPEDEEEEESQKADNDVPEEDEEEDEEEDQEEDEDLENDEEDVEVTDEQYDLDHLSTQSNRPQEEEENEADFWGNINERD